MSASAPAVAGAVSAPTKSVGKVLGKSGMAYMFFVVVGVIAKITELAMKNPPEELGPALTVIPILMIITGAFSIYGMLSGSELKAVMAIGIGFVIVFFFDKIVEYTQRKKLKKEVEEIEEDEEEEEEEEEKEDDE